MSSFNFTLDVDAAEDVSEELQSACDPGADAREESYWVGWHSGMSQAGEYVTPEKLMGYPPFNQAVTTISSDVAQVPYRLMHEVAGGDREIFWESDLDYLVSHRPNAQQTPSVFYETMMRNALLYGNGIAQIIRDGGGRAIALWPLVPEYTYPVEPIDVLEPKIWTQYAPDGPRFALSTWDTIHIKGLCAINWPTRTNWWGASITEVARNALGFSLTLEKFGSSTFRNGVNPGLVIKPPGKFTPESAAKARANISAVHAGSGNAGKTMILQSQTEVQELRPQTNTDAQWLDARLRDREYIASLFNIPAYKLNSMDNSSTRANLEEQNRDYLNSTLSRWLNRFVEEFNTKLIPQRNRQTNFFRSFPETFLRGDQDSRFANYQVGINARFLTPNEAREAEGLNPLPGGDELANPAIDTMADNKEKDEPENDEPETEETEADIENRVRSTVNSMLRGELMRRVQHREQKRLRAFYNAYEYFAVKYMKHLPFKNGEWKTVIRQHRDTAREMSAELIVGQEEKLTRSLIEVLSNGS